VGIGGLLDMARSVTVAPAKALFREILELYPSADTEEFAKLAQLIWSHFDGTVGELSDKHNLSSGNWDFELAADVFDGLIDVAEEYRSPDLPVAMIARYRGPVGVQYAKWRGSNP
jgi:hypothetical protein